MQLQKWTGERLETFIENETTIEHLHRYALVMSLIKGKSVLDIACGEGYGSNLIATTAKEVVGVDIDDEVIARAKVKYLRKNLSFFQGSASQIPLKEDIFDVVVSFETIEHHDQHDKMLDEIKRVLKPGGILIISSPDKLYYTEKRNFHNPYHVKELYKEEFKTLIKKHFAGADFYFQKAVFASFLLPEDKITGFKEFTGNYNAITADNDFSQMYILAIASDADLPDINFSVFTDEKLMSSLHAATVDLVHQTASYKLGHALLFPAIFCKNLFRKITP